MSKSKIQLEEEVGQLKADLSAAVADLEGIKAEMSAALASRLAKIKEEALVAEAQRQYGYEEAKQAYNDIVEKAKTVWMNVNSQKPELLGVAGQCARDGQLTILKEIFGDL